MEKKISTLVAALSIGGAFVLAATNVQAALTPSFTLARVTYPLNTINLIELTVNGNFPANAYDYSGKVKINWRDDSDKNSQENYADGEHESGHGDQLEDVVIKGTGGNQTFTFKHAYFKKGHKKVSVKIWDPACGTNTDACYVDAAPATTTDTSITVANSALKVEIGDLSDFNEFKFNRKIMQQGQALVVTDLSTDPTWKEKSETPNGPGESVTIGTYWINWGDGVSTFQRPTPYNQKPSLMAHYYAGNQDGDLVTIEQRVSYCNGSYTSPTGECDKYYSSGPIKVQLTSVENKLPIPNYTASLQSVGNDCVLKIIDHSIDPDYVPALAGAPANSGRFRVNMNNVSVSWKDDLMTTNGSESRELTYIIPTGWIWHTGTQMYKSYLQQDATGRYLQINTSVMDYANKNITDPDLQIQIKMPWQSIYLSPAELALGSDSKCQIAPGLPPSSPPQ